MAQYFENANLPSKIIEFESYFLNTRFVFKSDNGVFSKEKLDFGTRLLLENLPMKDMSGDILDLGCGYGVVSIILSKFINCNFDAVDVNKRALHLFEINIKLNNVNNINIFESDCYENVTKRYDYIITNPPIRAGKEVVYKMLRGAREHLKENGFLYFVMRKDHGANETATLIYYTNVTGGTTATQNNYAYYASAIENWHGPVTAAAQLPSTTQWSSTGLIAPGTRQITNEEGGTKTGNNTKDIARFTYTGKAARLLTYQEVQAACGRNLDNCNYLMENIGRYTGTSGTDGYWLESPRASNSTRVWDVRSSDYAVLGNSTSSGVTGVRPVITVLKSNISY